MPFSAIPKSLVVYSSPAALDRLRLDKEHKAIERVIAKHGLNDRVIRRIHAATLLDAVSAMREQDFELVQFSGHGDLNGLCLEGEPGVSRVSWSVLASTLRQCAPNLSVLILTTCFSSEAEKALHGVVPFLIAIDGKADDDAAIAFSENLFDEFYRSTAVEQAFRYATTTLDVLNLAEKIRPILIRRHVEGKSVVQACFDQRHDFVYVDITEAENDIANLTIDRHDFLSLLTRKIRVHRWIFRYPREKALLQIGPLFGEFSWQNANALVTCHRIIELRQGIAVETCLGWTRLLVLYNDLRSERYRMLDAPAAPENRTALQTALDSLENCFQFGLCRGDVSDPARTLAPTQYVVTCSTVRVHCDRARERLLANDLAEVVFSLETAVSSIHDLVDELTLVVTTRPDRERTSGPKATLL